MVGDNAMSATEKTPRAWQHRRMVSYLAIVLVGVFLVACAAPPEASGWPGEATRPASSARQEVARRQALPAAAAAPSAQSGAPQRAPDFAVRTLDGWTFRLAEWRGQALVLFFMASWCVSCSFEAEMLALLHENLRGRGLDILAVDVDPTARPEHLAAFRESIRGGDYLWALDESARLATAFGVRALDTTVVLDRERRVVYRDERPTRYATLYEVVAPLLR